jgi:cytochrome o ubiquinol oxidase subunit I
MFGFKLSERIGKAAFWCWIVGFFVSFTPIYILGLMGASRRLDQYDPSTGWQNLFMISALGLVIISAGALLQVAQVIFGILKRKENLDVTGDPWGGRGLVFATSSPPPFYNFAVIPKVTGLDEFTIEKKYEEFHMPKNTAMGIYISALVFLAGFGIVWHIVWLAVAGIIGAIICVIIRAFDENTEYKLSVPEIENYERRRTS